MSAPLDAWMKSGKYLPRFMRDFHDQKDLFKAIHQIINANETSERVGWVNGHIYVIDVFLWFMARRGYTLQKSRHNLDFRDIEHDVSTAKAERDKSSNAALMAFMNKDKL